MKTSQIDNDELNRFIDQILFDIEWAASSHSNIISYYDPYSGNILMSRSYRLYDLLKRPSKVLFVRDYSVCYSSSHDEFYFRFVSRKGLVSRLMVITKVISTNGGTSSELQVVKLSDLSRESEIAFTKPGN